MKDNYATAEEMQDTITCRVFYFMDGGFFEITPTDGKFTPSIGAIYKIEYSAYDLAGNRAVKNFYFQGVAAKEEGDEDNSSCSKAGCASIGIGGGVVVLGGIVFLVLQLKTKKKEKETERL